MIYLDLFWSFGRGKAGWRLRSRLLSIHIQLWEYSLWFFFLKDVKGWTRAEDQVKRLHYREERGREKLFRTRQGGSIVMWSTGIVWRICKLLWRLLVLYSIPAMDGIYRELRHLRNIWFDKSRRAVWGLPNAFDDELSGFQTSSTLLIKSFSNIDLERTCIVTIGIQLVLVPRQLRLGWVTYTWAWWIWGHWLSLELKGEVCGVIPQWCSVRCNFRAVEWLNCKDSLENTCKSAVLLKETHSICMPQFWMKHRKAELVTDL